MMQQVGLKEPADYDFLVPPQTVFGWGRRKEVGALAAQWGKRAFLVSGSRTLARSEMWGDIKASLLKAGVNTIEVATISHEPEVEDVDHTVAALKAFTAGPGDLLLAIGGGSAIDLAKAAAALVMQPGEASVVDYLEGVGRGLSIANPPLPLIAMPTTAGTGTEATKNAVISSYSPPFKKSLRHDLMIPRVALIDPELTVSVPPAVTAHTGLDALTQCIESYLSRRAKPIPQALAWQGMQLAFRNLPEAVRDGTQRPPREAMAHAALLSGMALANSGLGLAHGVAAALGVHAKTPHGLACAMMLPVAMRVNLEVCCDDLALIGEWMTRRSWLTTHAAAEAAIDCVTQLCRDLNVPAKLSEIGVTADQIPQLVSGSRGNSMNGNPCEVSDLQLGQLLESML